MIPPLLHPQTLISRVGGGGRGNSSSSSDTSSTEVTRDTLSIVLPIAGILLLVGWITVRRWKRRDPGLKAYGDRIFEGGRGLIGVGT